MVIEIIDRETHEGNSYSCESAGYYPLFNSEQKGCIDITEHTGDKRALFLHETSDFNVFYPPDSIENCALVLYKEDELFRECCYSDVDTITYRNGLMTFYSGRYYEYVLEIEDYIRTVIF